MQSMADFGTRGALGGVALARGAAARAVLAAAAPVAVSDASIAHARRA
jgi:hypothetical protein